MSYIGSAWGWIRDQFAEFNMLQVMFLGFGSLILIGTLLLKLPWSLEPGKTLTWTEALFTATSAVCVTGLIVVDTPVHFSYFGEAVILALFQVGGFGIVVTSATLFLSLRGSVSLTQRLSLRNVFLNWEFNRLRTGLLRALGIFITVEILGAAVLTWRFWDDYTPLQAAWEGLFHSVSAVCNAGFSINVDSLVGYGRDPYVVLTTCFLIIVGGLGFVVVAELTEEPPWLKERFSLHTRTVLVASVVLIVAGYVAFTLLEDAHWLEALFQSVTARTAGFNTVDISNWSTSSIMLFYLLMFIGAGPASMAGGVKVTSAVVWLVDFWRRITGREHAHWFDRRFSGELVNEALILLMTAAITVGLGVFTLTLVEPFPLKEIIFEVISAFGTVGLSLGITSELSVIGRWVIIVCMFVGRLGPLAFVFLLVRSQRPSYTYPEEDILIG